ncbi:MAG TPA: nucleotidyltransferase domain-containing protein [Clostridia bacterium]|nr:nucleotidyltransferase domain-containing protein [Clostridia bacterium]
MIKTEHNNFIHKSLEVLKSDPRFVGVAAAGSYITKEMDEYSDIDLVIAVKPESLDEVMRERMEIAKKMGNLLSAFTGEHVGAPSLLICLYADPLLHVDLKFASIDNIAHRVEDFIILWEIDGQVSSKCKEVEAKYPKPDLQWIEDRFWVWVHYGAGKVGRGELFEAIEFISFLRQNVIGPLILLHKGKQPRGVRKLEFDAPEYIERLKGSIASHDKSSCCKAIDILIDLYKELREAHQFEGLVLRTDAEKAAVDYFRCIADSSSRLIFP